MIHNMLGCYANIWIRQKVFHIIGEKIGGHKHKYDHVSILASGKVKVEVDGVEKEFNSPTFLVIQKDKVHNVTALTDDVIWYCIFAHRDINGEVFDSELNSLSDSMSATGFDANSIIINTSIEKEKQ